MPLARISVPAHLSADRVRALADAVHGGLVTTCNVPVDDHFQLITRFAPDAMIINPTFPARRTPALWKSISCAGCCWSPRHLWRKRPMDFHGIDLAGPLRVHQPLGMHGADSMLGSLALTWTH
jgi:hypothetical protein